MTYGGNEEIVLKGPGEIQKQEKTEKLQSQRMYMHNVHQVFFCQNSQILQNRMRDVQLMTRYNIYKGQKKYPWSGSYTRSGKDSQNKK
jgi:hypothetical protein